MDHLKWAERRLISPLLCLSHGPPKNGREQRVTFLHVLFSTWSPKMEKHQSKILGQKGVSGIPSGAGLFPLAVVFLVGVQNLIAFWCYDCRGLPHMTCHPSHPSHPAKAGPWLFKPHRSARVPSRVRAHSRRMWVSGGVWGSIETWGLRRCI